MKKPSQIDLKLSLSTQTLRQLSLNALTMTRGGSDTGGPTCYRTGTNCPQ
jgi:hypothetical protein